MNENAIAKVFGENLKKIRKEKGVSQEKLAFKAGLHPTYISLLERGERQPTLSTMIALSNSLEIPITTLIEPFI